MTSFTIRFQGTYSLQEVFVVYTMNQQVQITFRRQNENDRTVWVDVGTVYLSPADTKALARALLVIGRAS